MKISVSYLASKLSHKDSVKKIEYTNADFIHVDLMDGKFVPIKNFTPGEVLTELGNASKPLDIHLMTLNPSKYVKTFSLLNVAYITFHVEAVKNVLELIDEIKGYGIKVGISIKPETKIEDILDYLDKIDLVLIMSVAPGAGGQKFIETSKDKIEKLMAIKKDNDLNYLVSIDGGINDEILESLEIKPDIIVCGTFITNSDDYQTQINKLK